MDRRVWTPEDRFGREMRRVRESKGWSQARLAEEMTALGVPLHSSAIAKMEAREVDAPRVIRLNEAVAISRALGLPLGQFSRDALVGVQAALERAVAHQEAMRDALREGDALLREAGAGEMAPQGAQDVKVGNRIAELASQFERDAVSMGLEGARELVDRILDGLEPDGQ